jgi:hypothetical protein
VNVIDSLIAWWNKPPAEERILDAMSFTEWRRGITIIDETDLSIGQFYVTCERLVEQKVIEKRYDMNGQYPRIFFRKLKSGYRRRYRLSVPHGSVLPHGAL